MTYRTLAFTLTVFLLLACERKYVNSPGPVSDCTIEPNEYGAYLSCPDGTKVQITNGKDAAENDYDVMDLIDPCGKEGTFDELILRLRNGILLAHYSTGNKQFITQLHPGNYVTTDGTNCHFTVNNDLDIMW